MDILAPVTNRLQEVLDAKDKTAYWLSKQLNIKPPFVYRVCKNEASLSIDNAYKIKKILGLGNIEELYILGS